MQVLTIKESETAVRLTGRWSKVLRTYSQYQHNAHNPYVADGYPQWPVIGPRKVFGIEGDPSLSNPFLLSLHSLKPPAKKTKASISTLSSPPSHPPHTQWLPSLPPRTPPRASPSTAASPSPALCAAVSPTALSLLWMCKSKAQVLPH